MKQVHQQTAASGNGQLRESIKAAIAARTDLNAVFSHMALLGQNHLNITKAIQLVPTEKRNPNLRQAGINAREFRAALGEEAKRKARELLGAIDKYMADSVTLKIAPSFASIGVEVTAPPIGNNAVHATAKFQYPGVMPQWIILWQAPVTETNPGVISPIRLQPERNLGTGLKEVEIPLKKFDTFRREAHKMTVVTLKAACENFAYEVLYSRNDLFERINSPDGKEFRMLSGKDKGHHISIEMRHAGLQLVPIVNIGPDKHEMNTFKGALDFAVEAAQGKNGKD